MMNKKNQELTLGNSDLSCQKLAAALQDKQTVSMTSSALERIRSARQVVDDIVASGIPAYGVNTGVGSQKDHAVDASAVKEYNQKLIKGHATRVPGKTWSATVVRGALIVLLNEFSVGKSGVSEELIQLMVDKVNHTEMPTISVNGSISASDLVPLAQTADWLLSFPEAKAVGLPHAKEALSLRNCNAFTLSAGAVHIVELGQLLKAFDLAAAVTMEGFRCNLDAIAEPVNAVHRRHGQAQVAERLRNYLDGSHLWQTGQARFLQDPLSFRMVSQIHGAVFEVADRLESVWNDELNSVNDNPIIGNDEKLIYSHGNMDTTRFTLALDSVRQGLAKISDVSGERIHKLQWPTFSDLPIGLVEEGTALGGVQFLNLGHIAASLITSVKHGANSHLQHSVGQVADGVEDTSGQAMHAVLDLQHQLEACWKIIAIEMAVAVWAIHRRRLAKESLGKKVQLVYDQILPLLPIGSEGEAVFDLSELINTVRHINCD